VDLTSGTLVGKYRLESPLAQGGMGALWMARHVRLGTPVAIKFLIPSLATSRRSFARFEREAHAATVIQSPHIVQVHDFGVEQDTPYLVMELLVGENLGQRLARDKRLPLDETARILIQIGKALRRAHAAGIVHRDLKPGNLFLANDDDEEIVKILDFGIAKAKDTPLPEQTEPGTMLGSPNYMSPEQAAGDRTVDHRADLWSLAVVLYQAVTGELPFQGATMGSVLRKVYLSAPRRVTEIDPELPPELDDFFHKALAKKRAERFQSIDDLVVAFVSVAAPDESIPPPSIGRPAPVPMPCTQAEEPCCASPVPSDVTGEAPPPTASLEDGSARARLASIRPVHEAPTARLGPPRSAPPGPLSVTPRSFGTGSRSGLHARRHARARLTAALPWIIIAVMLVVPAAYGLFFMGRTLAPVARTVAARLMANAAPTLPGAPDSPPPNSPCPSPEPASPARADSAPARQPHSASPMGPAPDTAPRPSAPDPRPEKRWF